MKRTNSQNKRLHKLLGQLQIDAENKEVMVSAFTNGRTCKSSEMSNDECEAMINRLLQMTGSIKPVQSPQRLYNEILQRKRRQIFALMYDLGFIFNIDSKERKMHILNAWIDKKMKLETIKTFNDLSELELQKMITQLQTVKRNYTEKAENNAKLN